MADLIAQVAGLQPNRRKLFFKQLVANFETELLHACRKFEKCEACNRLASSTRLCQGDGDCLEKCCKSCITYCVYGDTYAPSYRFHHNGCHRQHARCYCGDTLNLDQKEEVHCEECKREAKVFLVVDDLTDAQKNEITACGMEFEGGVWVSKAFTVTALSTVKSMAEDKESIFYALVSGALEPLEVVVFVVEFTNSAGVVVKDVLLDFDRCFGVPNQDSDEVYPEVNFRITMQAVGSAKKRKIRF